MKKLLLIVLYLALCAVYFLHAPFHYRVALPAFMLCLTAPITTIIRNEEIRMLPWPMAFAFFFSGMGDCMGADRNLILQIAFFGVAHIFIICYNIHVLRTKGLKLFRAQMWPAYLFIALVLVLAMTIIFPNVETPVLKVCVMAYIVLISTMAVSAASVSWACRVAWPFVGGVLFLISDFTLAGGRFLGGFFLPNSLVMPTYYGALLSLWLGTSDDKLEMVR